jgi:uncharacterized protein YbaR (Trm112 family)
MMLTSEVVRILCCPDDRSPLLVADVDLMNQANSAIRAGKLVNRAGNPIKQPLEGGLVRADGAVLYPIVDGIPVLLRDDGIPLEQLRD